MLQNKLKTHFHIPFNRIWYWPFQETNITYSFFFIIVSISLQLMNELTLDERSTILKRPFCYLLLPNKKGSCGIQIKTVPCWTDTFLQTKTNWYYLPPVVSTSVCNDSCCCVNWKCCTLFAPFAFFLTSMQ